MRVWSLSKQDNTSTLFIQKKDNECNIYAENTRCLEMRRGLVWEDGFARGPVLNITGCCRDDRYSIEVQVSISISRQYRSRVRIVNGVVKYVTEAMLTKEEEDTASVKPVAKARPRRMPTVPLTSVSVLVLERKWIDIETQRSHDHKCYTVSKATTRLLRQDQSVPRGSDGAIHYSDIMEECRKQKFDDASQWSLNDWISILAKGGGAKKRFQYCLNLNSSKHISYFRVIHRDIMEIMLLILHCKTMCCSQRNLLSTSITSGTRVNWIQ